MQQPTDDFLERQLAEMQAANTPSELRSRVLAGVHDELAAARWDRRVARAAVILLAVGVGINASMVLQADRPSGTSHFASGRSQQSLVNAAVAVAEATDPETGRQFARQLAAQSGRPLTPDQMTAIDDAIERQITRL